MLTCVVALLSFTGSFEIIANVSHVPCIMMGCWYSDSGFLTGVSTGDTRDNSTLILTQVSEISKTNIDIFVIFFRSLSTLE